MAENFTIKPLTWFILLTACAAFWAAIVVGLYYLIKGVF